MKKSTLIEIIYGIIFLITWISVNVITWGNIKMNYLFGFGTIFLFYIFGIIGSYYIIFHTNLTEEDLK